MTHKPQMLHGGDASTYAEFVYGTAGNQSIGPNGAIAYKDPAGWRGGRRKTARSMMSIPTISLIGNKLVLQSSKSKSKKRKGSKKTKRRRKSK